MATKCWWPATGKPPSPRCGGIEPPVVTVDLGLPPDPDGATEGLATLQQILALAPDTKVIVVTGNQDRANAVKAVGMGAYDFHQKPFDPEMLGTGGGAGLPLPCACSRKTAGSSLPRRIPPAGHHQPGSGMLKVCRSVEKVAPSDATVMLLGESGTGKEAAGAGPASACPRAAKNGFMAINCAAIPENLLESELFGYEKGAFTGAAKQTLGKIEVANGGTFFLDEVGDLPAALQAKLLRFLQERVMERLGGREEIPVDVRIVCATHQNLKELMEAGRFREDLYYRLSEIVVDIPPLRDRAGDAALLAHAFLNKFSNQEGRPVRGFSQEALNAIEGHGWPGNVREMENLHQARRDHGGRSANRPGGSGLARTRKGIGAHQPAPGAGRGRTQGAGQGARQNGRKYCQGGRTAGRQPADPV